MTAAAGGTKLAAGGGGREAIMGKTQNYSSSKTAVLIRHEDFLGPKSGSHKHSTTTTMQRELEE